ncbi:MULTISPECIES: inositol 2-dehydrogenase [Pelosinus]|jgi:myo-inositol 2-dehydrogenase/D-chiro-inositol 1-dehydrogenase|uniref:Oxidoreductase domain protein n=1 Tax=Pelosinus fermentans B4 TaxID=1149862 RepID=I9B151_9FIRM|nr:MULTISPECIES: inositol 2-dehydrogenase [Pelosinus]EIW18837.1 oxidoreductase domain protein [Pelosinus fermentans B4]EIW21953.1 oxidoreductase domain protein [Pelosinus fermentans A11]OAM95196.1 Inositol 2-dehydrogenase [Pelosinus fermentans DSM 17108]SDR24618.1 myo-inositol 2-dehydrogenase [Pelosinus fermentans]
MTKQLKIGIIGMGRIGKLHGNNLAFSVPNSKIEAVADLFLNDEMRAWAQGLGVQKIYNNPAQIFSDPAIEAVFICSSSEAHADLIIQAAAAKKHIFCEKPIHTDADQIRKALNAVEKAGVKLQVGFVRRFDHNHKKVRDVVASGQMGAPHIVKVTSRDPEPQSIEYVSTSGGIFLDMMIHDFDMVRYLSGSEVTEVTAIGAIKIDERIREFSDVDTAIVLLKFENGAIGVIDNSRAARYGYDQRVEVHCDKGCVQDYNDLIDTTIISTKDGVRSERPKWFFLERYNQAFIAEAQEFTAAVLNNTEPSVTGIDGLMPVLIAKAAQKSLDEGRTVKLTEFA